MSPTPVLAGALRHARIECRIQLFSWMGLTWLVWPAIGLFVLFFLRDSAVMGSDVSLAQLGTPGVIAMYLISAGIMGVGGALMTEREDGTLLRAKAVPGGIAAHLLGAVITYSLVALVPILAVLAAAGLLIDGVVPASPARWALLVGVCVLGLSATLPVGAALGALLSGPMSLGIVAMTVYVSMAISGIFYPISALPGWLQVLGQALPTYWVGLGLRAAILPPEAVALELHASWQTPQTVLALLVWTAIGLVLAPIGLRRMARRQSGSAVSAARDRVMAKGY